MSERLSDGFGEVERLSEDAATAFDSGEFEGAIDLGFETGGVVEQAVQKGADMRVLMVEIGEGLGLKSDAGERGTEFVGHGGEERLERAGSFGIAPVEVGDEGEAEEERGEEGGSFPKDHALGSQPLTFSGGVGDAQLFFETGNLAGLGEHQKNPPSAQSDDEGQPGRLEGDQEFLIGGPMAMLGMSACPDHD